MTSADTNACRKCSLTGHLAVLIWLMVLGPAPAPVSSAASAAQPRSSPSPSVPGQSTAGNGIIAGVVVNERQEPVARARVQAFLVPDTPDGTRQGHTMPFPKRANGSASTDADGRFRISGLELGEYLVAAEAHPSLRSGATSQTPIYATTFYPSTTGDQEAVRVAASALEGLPIQIDMVRVKGARVAGSVVSHSGRPSSGMDVRLFRGFGNFASESTVAVVDTQGHFETSRVPPGWYRLTVAPRHSASNGEHAEFATRLIEVHDQDIDGLVLVLGPGASISGRVVAERGPGRQPAPGVRVHASPTKDQYGALKPITARVASDGSFRMSGLSGSYQFTAVGTDRPPGVKATRITIDGVETAVDTGIALTEGNHELVVFVTPHTPPVPAVDKTLSPAALVALFRREPVFWRQFSIARAIVDRRDTSVLPPLEPWLSHEDRHIRGNVAFVFAGLNDPRGFRIIADILTDRSDRPPGQGISGGAGDGRYRVERQIAADRYYAAHLFGDLRDRRAVPILAALLKDKEVSAIVPWALEQIGDKSAVEPLLEALDGDDPAMRVLVIYALEGLKAKEAVPRLISLLDDHRRSNLGAQVSVAEAAQAAIAKLR